VCVDLLDYNGDSYSWRVHFRNERKKTVEKVLKLVENGKFLCFAMLGNYNLS